MESCHGYIVALLQWVDFWLQNWFFCRFFTKGLICRKPEASQLQLHISCRRLGSLYLWYFSEPCENVGVHLGTIPGPILRPQVPVVHCIESYCIEHPRHGPWRVLACPGGKTGQSSLSLRKTTYSSPPLFVHVEFRSFPRGKGILHICEF